MSTAPQVSVTAIANGNEANGSPAMFRFSRTGSTTDPLSVSYRLLGTAQAGSDYSGATTGTISFSAGSATAELSLPALADSVVDPGETILAQIVPSTTATPSYLITPGQQTANATITAEGMMVTVNGPGRPGWSKGEVGNRYAFAALKSDGTVVSWGESTLGGTTPAGLGGVTQIFSNFGAFAALKSDGTVVCWGTPSYGGTTPAGLGGVTQIFSTHLAFAALKSDGTVVCWGSPTYGGTTPAGLGGVTQIFSSSGAFAALKSDGTVVSWGDPSLSGTTPAGLGGVTQIFSNNHAFAALKSDGTVVSWGDPSFGGTTPAGLGGVTQIFSSYGAFAALKSDGTVVSWGDPGFGGTTPAGLGGVTQIFSTGFAFAALKSDGTVVCWGSPSYGGTTAAGLGGVTQIFSTDYTFAALKSDGTVVSWGEPTYGGTTPAGLGGVTQIFSSAGAFAALKSDGTVVSWGDPSYGGTPPAGLGGVTQIFSTGRAFAALKSDGTVVSWGDPSWGGTTPAGLSGVVSFANPYTDDLLVLPSINLAVAVAQSAVAEDGTTNLVYTFTRSGFTTSALTVNYAITGTADATDYTGATPGAGKTITFAAGSATATLTIDPTVDTTTEGDETVLLTLAAGTDYTIGTTAAVTGTILNDDSPQVSVTAIANGNEADGSPVLFRFSRTGSTTDPLSVSYRLLGTAQAGSDYTGATTGTISFSAGSATAELSLPALADTVIDPGETIIAQIVPSPTAPASYLITPGQQTATATITAEGMVVVVNGRSRSWGSTREYGNGAAFAAIRGDGSVVTWGADWSGGDSSGVALQLGYGIKQIFSNSRAFAALKSDGSVVTWGNGLYGGDSNEVAGQLSSGVTQIFSTGTAFAALKTDGSVVTWGERWSGGNSNGVAAQLSSGVTQIFSNGYAFAALKDDGSVVTWDSITFGGDSSGVAGQLSSGVTQIFSNLGAFAALKSDGSVVTWGYGPWGGDSSGVASRLSSGINKVYATTYAFAALKGDGSVVVWGDDSYGGDSSGVAGQLSSGVTQIFSASSAFAALKADGSVVTWGQGAYGGDSSAVAAKLSSGVTQIFSNGYAFAALKGDGSVVSWGLDPYGGNSNGFAIQLSSGVTQIFSTSTAFAALKGDGSVVTWGDSTGGANSNGVAGQLSSGVTQIVSNGSAFAALKADGSVVTWGNGSYGGDSSGVAGQLKNIVAFANPITDDRLEVFADLLPSITLLAGTPTAAREDGNTTLQFTFIRTGRTDSELTVNYTVGGTATLDTDYTGIAALPATKAITFAAGSATATVVIDPIADTEIEADETVFLTLAAGTGYFIGTSTAVASTIVNDDLRSVGSVISVPIPVSNLGRTGGEVRNRVAFAAIRSDGSVVTWGMGPWGGDSSEVADQLSSGVTQIFSNQYAFAALKADGSVVTWGEGSYGGDSSGEAVQLSSGVTQIFSSGSAFAALKADGSVVTWGDDYAGGDSSRVADQLSSSVTQIFSTWNAFAALKADGSVVTWGDDYAGGDSSRVADQLSSGVTQIFSSGSSFAALKADGSVVTWGDDYAGDDSSGVADQLSSSVTQIFSTWNAFAALKADGSVVTWGDDYAGGDSSWVADQLSSGVTQIFSSGSSFAALKADGSVVTWGEGSYGGDSSGVAGQLSSGVTQIYSTGHAFAALKADGSVVTWGADYAGGDSSGVAGQLSSGVIEIFSNVGDFAALKADGSVVTWGLDWSSGDSSGVADQLSSGVTQIFSNHYAFAALKADGSVVTWGPDYSGGDSSGVAPWLTNVVAFANPFTDDRLVFDALPSISLAVSPASAGEDGTADLIYTFTRTGATTSELSVNYTVGGNASLGTDYTGIAELPATKAITFAAGSATATVVIDPIADTEIEVDETVSLTLSAGTGYTIGTTEAVIATINDLLLAPTIDAITGDDNLSVSEYEVGITITGSGNPSATVTIQFEDAFFSPSGDDIPPAHNVVVNSDGQWSLNLSPAQVDLLGVGDDMVIAYQSWPGSDGVSETSYRLFTIESAPAPTIDVIGGDDVITTAEAIAGFTIQGTGVPGATILLAFSSGYGVEAGAVATVDASGIWSLSISPQDVVGFAEGFETIEVSQQLLGTGFSSGVTNRSFVIEAAPLPTVDGIATDNIISPEEAQLGFSITGSGLPGATIILLFASGVTPEVGSSVDVNQAGRWSFFVSPSDIARIGPISETIEVYQVITQLGLTSPAVPHDFLIEDAPVPSIDAITGDDSISASDLRSGFVISGRGMPGSTIHLEFDSGTLLQSGSTALVAADATWSVSVVQTDAIGFDLGQETVLVRQTIPVVGFTSGAVSNTFTVEVINLPPSAVALNNAVTSLAENSSTLAAIKVADIAITDDVLGSNIISLEGADAAIFEVVGTSLFLKAGTSLDFEAKASYSLTVSVSDPSVAGSIPVTASYTLAIADVNEAPTAVVLNNSITSLEENTATLTAIKVADIAITDDALGSNTISLAGADAASFEVVGSGLFLKAATNLNYEAKTSYSLTVSVSDPSVAGSVPVTTSYALAITDVNEAPTSVVLNNTVTILEENTPTLTAIKVADIAVTDDALGSNTISLAGADAASFEVVGSGLFLKAGTSLDYETKASYSLTVSVSDPSVAGSVPVTTSYALSITDVNEAPTAVVLNNRITSLEENTPTLTAIKVADIAITDDALGSNTISLAGADAASFEVVGSGLFLKAGTSLDYETKASYSLTVSVSDPSVAGSAPVTTSYGLAVRDLNEAPTAINLSAIAFDENIPAGSQIALLSTADPDSNPQSFTYSLVSGTGSTHNLFFSVLANALRITRSPDYETRSNYSIRLRTTDQGGLFNERSVALNVNDLLDSPTYSFSKSADVVYERGALAIGVSTNNVAAGKLLYWSLSGTNITASDFSDGTLLGSVSLGNDGKASFSKVVAADGLIEPDESLDVKFFNDAARSQQIGNTLSVTLKEPVLGVVSDGPDIITGTSANDVITGVPTGSSLRGRGTVDRLTGGGGNDQFLLADRTGSYYNDGDASTDGSADIAVITDFNAGDSIRLFGSASLYQLSQGVYGGSAGLWIRILPTGGGVSERIGFVQSATLSNLNLNSASQFTYLN